MSNPDRLTRLKTTVEIYEKEWRESGNALQRLQAAANQAPSDAGLWVAAFGRLFDTTAKLLTAYREYAQELEKLVPR